MKTVEKLNFPEHVQCILYIVYSSIYIVVRIIRVIGK